MIKNKAFSVNKMIIIVIVVLVLLIIVAGALKGKNKQNIGPNTVAVTYGDITQTAVAAGHVVPVGASQVKSQISGTVVKIFHDVGDYVKVGDPLVQLRPNPTPQELISTKQNVANAKAALSLAESNYQRMHTLFLKHLKSAQDDQKSKETFDRAKNDYDANVQSLNFLTQGKTTVNGQEKDAVVTSSVEGYILKRNLNIGDSVVPISTYQAGSGIFVIADLKNMVFEGTVDEIDIKNIKRGMDSSIIMAAMPKDVLKGQVSQIGVADLSYSNDDSYKLATNQSSKFSITIDHIMVPDNMILRAGYSATANIVVKKVSHVLLVPEYTLHFDGDKTYVMILQDGKSKRVDITLGLEDGIKAEVKSGLKDGDLVVVGDKV